MCCCRMCCNDYRYNDRRKDGDYVHTLQSPMKEPRPAAISCRVFSALFCKESSSTSKLHNRNLKVTRSQSEANKLPHAITAKVIQRGET
jgi:hypothetical protein